MKLWWTIEFVTIMHFIQSQAVRGVSFVVEPMSKNVSEGTEAIFNCTAYSSGYHWLINDHLPESNENKDRGLVKENRVINATSKLSEHILIVPGKISNSGITIKCYIYWEESQLSSPVTLLVQGLLDTVSDLQAVQLNLSTVFISYEPPYTLEGVPIRNYSINIFVSGNSSLRNAYSTSTESISLPIDSPCYEYSINISAWNDVGEGKIASTSVILYEVPYPPPSSSRVSVQFLSDSTVRAILHTTIMKDCLGRVPDNITIILDPSNEEQQSIVTITASCLLEALSCDNNLISLIDSSEEGKVDVSVDLSAVVARGSHYKAYVFFSNMIGNISSPAIDLNTFRITSAEVTATNSVCLKCIFANGNLTEGCLGVFVDRSKKTPIRLITVPFQYGISCFYDFPPGDYNVLVYDSEQSENLAFEFRIVVHKPSRSIYIPTAMWLMTTTFSREELVSSTTTINIHSTGQLMDTGTLPEMHVLVIALSVSSGTLVLLSLLIVSLVACLMKYKKKISKLKIAEFTARQRQRSTEVFLHTLMAPTSPCPPAGNGVISNGYYDTPTLPSVKPLYENVEEIQQQVALQNNLEMTECPAYMKMPTKS